MSLLIEKTRNLRPRYNIAPTTPVDVIRQVPAGRELVSMRWGLVPGWWKKSLKDVPATFNARAESVADNLMFRGAYKARRCIVPASGFFEWTGEAKGPAAAFFQRRTALLYVPLQASRKPGAIRDR